MCGLVGLAGDSSLYWKDVFTELLIIDSIRGMHSTGAAAVKRWDDSKVEMAKCPGPSHNLITSAAYKTLLSYPAKALIGHNRYATMGAHTVENAHPFEFENVVGAHNGTLDKWSVKFLHEFEKFDTDSEAIFSHLNKYNIREVMNQVSGAWALTWFDRRDDTINFIRNDKRPLYYCYSKDRCTLLWASERDMLDFVMRRHGNDMGDKFYVVQEDSHYSWKIPTSLNEKFGEPTRIKMEAKKTFFAADDHIGYEYSYGSNWHSRAKYTAPEKKAVVKVDDSSSTGTSNVLPFLPTPKEVQRVNTAKFRPPYKNHKNMAIKKSDFETIVSQGCIFCDDNTATWGEFIKILEPDMEGRPMFLCEECYNNDEVLETCSFVMAN